ncbi:beta-1,3-glucanase family protein [Streptomyces sp. NPDC096012]|uniref:beta-1,3-glucanase family protein n=1 Tax=Streptomyces sp. NPDC096012 TaxID=3155684 RepID=UPI00336A476A
MQTTISALARRPARLRTALGLVVVLLAACIAVLTPSPAHAADQLLSQGRPATASSTESGAFPATAAVDGNTGTRWSSAFTDPQWLQVDLGFTAYAQSAGVDAATSDIFGCAASLAGNPGMCAALNRHVSTLPASQQADPSQYYTAAPANYYAKFWHDNDINHLAYGFPYDDVAGQSSFISHGNPQWLLVAVGW